jgi:hypothetical protein
MKNSERILDRIFALARRSSLGETPDVPFGLETAVLAHWKRAKLRAENSGLLPAMRWAALAACATALLVSALRSDELAAFRNRFDPETRVAESALVAGYGND